MNETLKQLLEQYETAKLETRKFEGIIAALQPQILKLLPEDQEVATKQGVFFIQKRPTWKYSSSHESMKNVLKEKEKMEIADGTAKATYKSILYYRENKKEE